MKHMRWWSDASALLVLLMLLRQTEADNGEVLKLFGFRPKNDLENVFQRKQAPMQRFSYYVSLRKSPIDFHYCAGTLISPHYILTSASCMDTGVQGPLVQNVTAHIGIHLQDPTKSSRRRSKNAECAPQLSRKIAEVIIHPKYTNGTRGRPPYDAQYDIALIKLTKLVRLGSIQLPYEQIQLNKGDALVNVGLGRAETSGGYAKSLEMAAFPFMPYSQCRKEMQFSDNEFLGGNKNMSRTLSICVDGTEGYCQLDIGSALVLYRGRAQLPILIGFANRATQECSFGEPYVFTNIVFHVKWIQSIDGVLDDLTSAQVEKICGKSFRPAIQGKVAGGADAIPNLFPYAVSVREVDKIHRCQGVLISPGHVLTAASCVSDPIVAASQVECYIGGLSSDPYLDKDDDEIKDAVLVGVDEIIYHPRFDAETRAVDLAILVLSKRVKLDPVRLPFRSRDCCPANTTMYVFSWGSLSSMSTFARKLQTGAMEYIPKKECIKVHGVNDLNPKSICGGGQSLGASLCRGDDGTPMILTGGVEHVLIGMGFSSADGTCGTRPTEFLRIAFFLKWIKENVPELK